MKLHDPVGNYMATEVIAGKSNMSLLTIAKIFAEEDINHLPIVDDDLRPIGMVSSNDLARISNWKSFFQPELHKARREGILNSLLAEDIMQAPVVSLDESASLVEAADIINRRRLHCIVIVDNQSKLSGIITAHDLLRLAFSNGGAERRLGRIVRNDFSRA